MQTCELNENILTWLDRQTASRFWLHSYGKNSTFLTDKLKLADASMLIFLFALVSCLYWEIFIF